MRRGPISGGVLLALLCALAFAATASAAPTKRGPELLIPANAFTVQGTNGYTISGSFYQREKGSNHGTLAVNATRGGESVGYAVPARVTPNSVRANLGRLGRVDLTLHFSGEEATATFQCSEQSFKYEPGTFEGTFEFHGEGGFTRASATTMAAVPDFSLPTLGPPSCEGYGETFSSIEPGARLKAVSYAGGHTLKFQLNKNGPKTKTIYTASLSERHGGMRIHREVNGTAPASAFRFGKSLSTATVSPPAPFSGTARVRRSPNAVSPLFTGNLTLAFPGRTVELDGPAVHLSLEHARQTHEDEEGGTFTVGI